MLEVYSSGKEIKQEFCHGPCISRELLVDLLYFIQCFRTVPPFVRNETDTKVDTE